MANNRELSQLASFVTVDDTSKTIAFGSTIASLNVTGVGTFGSLTVGGVPVTAATALHPTLLELNVTGVSTFVGVATFGTVGITTVSGDLYVGGAATVTGSLNLAYTNGEPVIAGKGASVGVNTTNTAFGVDVLQNIDVGGQQNTAFGYNALKNATTTQQNVAIGNSALAGIDTSGYQNTAVGNRALQALGGGDNSRGHTAIGNDALSSLVTPDGVGITAVGQAAGRALTSGQQSTIIGYGAYTWATTGSSNVIVGNSAAEGQGAGLGRTLTSSVAIGFRSMYTTGIGTTNTAVGTDSLYSGDYQNSSGFGAYAAVTGSNQVQLGNAATTTYAYGAVQDRSDARDKADVRDTTLGLDFISKLRPVDFKWDYRDDYKSIYELAEMSADEQAQFWANPNKDGSRKRSRYHHGLIAQEVKSTLDELGIDFGGYQHHSISGGKDVMTIGYNELIAPLIKAVQELKARVEALEGS